MAIATLETALYQGQIFLADGTGKSASRSKTLEFGFEVCIHNSSVTKELLYSKQSGDFEFFKLQ